MSGRVDWEVATAVNKPRVAIVGAGPGGIAMGIQLADGGYDFTIFDRSEGFGGTWRNNTYPGAACDVPSHFYSYSFALNPRWSKTFANQPEILAYLENVAADNELADHLVPRTRVSTMCWSDDDRRWTVTTADGATHEFDAVVTAVGMLDVPNIPDIPGADRFRGRAFHSSNWDHSRSTAGERVASIGTGASAIQYVPEIAADAAHLTVFQRTPIWVSPRYDEPFTPEQQELFEVDPAEALKVRDAAFEAYESANFGADSAMTQELTAIAQAYLTRKVADPELRAKLAPAYPVGCKRPLQSRAWFPTFARSNVTLETSPIAEFTERGLRTAGGTEHEFDTVIYGTGFHAADYLRSLDVYGTGGRRLRDDWSDGAEAYLGTVVPGYPNLFTLYGPNTNGVTSIIYILEAQTEFVRRLLDDMGRAGVQAVDVKHEIHQAYNAEIQRAMQGTVWLANCNNYYRHPNGKVVTQFPYSGTTFAEMLARAELDEFDRLPPTSDRKEATACPESTTRR
jgi:cation diffusion facilitator CzcD-associated flavoprotein CzcO